MHLCAVFSCKDSRHTAQHQCGHQHGKENMRPVFRFNCQQTIPSVVEEPAVFYGFQVFRMTDSFFQCGFRCENRLVFSDYQQVFSPAVWRAVRYSASAASSSAFSAVSQTFFPLCIRPKAVSCIAYSKSHRECKIPSLAHRAAHGTTAVLL